MDFADSIISADDAVLVTGATGFIGAQLARRLVEIGFRNVRCLVRPSGGVTRLDELTRLHGTAIKILEETCFLAKIASQRPKVFPLSTTWLRGPEQSPLPMRF